jgi:hypothetical protein
VHSTLLSRSERRLDYTPQTQILEYKSGHLAREMQRFAELADCAGLTDCGEEASLAITGQSFRRNITPQLNQD